MVAGNNASFNAAADFNADGLIDDADLQLFIEDYVDQLRVGVDFGDAPEEYVRPFFSSDLAAAPAPISVSVAGGDVGIQDTINIDLGGLSRDDTDTGSLYFNFTIDPTQIASGTMVDAFAGVQLFSDGSEGLGFGNRFDTSLWSYFGNASGDLNSDMADSGSNETIVEGVERSFLVRVQYVAGGDDAVTVWLHPDDVLDNQQSVTGETTFAADASFDEIRVRAGSDSGAVSWTVSDFDISRQLKPGPAHIIGGPFLGSLVDPDGGQQTSVSATGDDQDGSDDEDGISFNGSAIAGQNWPVDVTASEAGFLDAWIDYNQDGVFSSDEHIGNGDPIALDAGTTPLSIAVPGTVSSGTALARFRITSAGGVSPTSYAIDGEVEDFFVPVLNTPPAVLGVWTQADWDADLLNFLDPVGGNGYQIPFDPGATIAWPDLNEIKIQFSEDVSASLTPESIVIGGVNTAEIAYTSSFDTATNTLTLTTGALQTDKYRLTIHDVIADVAGIRLDGELAGRIDSDQSGDGVGGGRLDLRFDVLPGDLNLDNLVTAGDFQPIGQAFFTRPGDANYDPRADLNGDALVTAGDFQPIGTYFFQSLPSGEPEVPVAPAGALNLTGGTLNLTGGALESDAALSLQAPQTYREYYEETQRDSQRYEEDYQTTQDDQAQLGPSYETEPGYSSQPAYQSYYDPFYDQDTSSDSDPAVDQYYNELGSDVQLMQDQDLYGNYYDL